VVLRYRLRDHSDFAYGAVTRYGRPFQAVRLSDGLVTLLLPALQPRQWLDRRFGLFPVRSPLLGESLLISFPAGTEMFQFPAFASPDLCIQSGITRYDPGWVSPFGYLRIDACLRLPGAYRS
jgi:hypothetical protein